MKRNVMAKREPSGRPQRPSRRAQEEETLSVALNARARMVGWEGVVSAMKHPICGLPCRWMFHEDDVDDLYEAAKIIGMRRRRYCIAIGLPDDAPKITTVEMEPNRVSSDDAPEPDFRTEEERVECATMKWIETRDIMQDAHPCGTVYSLRALNDEQAPEQDKQWFRDVVLKCFRAVKENT